VVADRAARHQSPTDLVLSKLEAARQSSAGWSARCPAHEDQRASLSVREGESGRALLNCFAGCELSAIVAALGLTVADLFPPETHRNGHAPTDRRITATYDYRDAQGALLYQAVRYAPKDFRQRRPDDRGGWLYHLDGVERVLYCLPELLAADPAQPVYVPEGEKDVDNLRALGLGATCNVGGAGKWRRAYSAALRGRHVVILPDHDQPGADHAEGIAQHVYGLAASVKIVKLPGLPPKGDVSDWLSAGGTTAQLTALVEAAPHWRPAAAAEEEREAEDAALDAALRTRPWPQPLDPAAYHGLAGDIVRTLDPHTESDPVAILAQVLVAFGNCIGRTAYYAVEADLHYGNLFAVLVGPTAKGRKGTSLGHVRRLFAAVDETWATERQLSGLTSGEGLVWNVRDPDGKDAGEADKRLLAVESEYASVLRVVGREGNTLSARIREAWDTGRLSTLVKNAPARATGAHISIIGHITRDELRRYLETTEVANGLANRHLWLCVKRSKSLPRGGRIQDAALAPLVQRLHQAVAFARQQHEIAPDDATWQVWDAIYPRLSAGLPGLLGAVLSRAEAQVMRLATLYALLDYSAVIQRAHLLAGLAVWEYAEASARYIFGDALGDPTADDLLQALRATPAGMTRTQIRDHFGRNKSAGEIGRALGLLLEYDLAYRRSEATDGRTAERWLAR
jgi:hypothetical protein